MGFISELVAPPFKCPLFLLGNSIIDIIHKTEGNIQHNFFDKNYFQRILALHLNSIVHIGYILEVGLEEVKTGAGWQDNTSRRKQCNRNHIHQS